MQHDDIGDLLDLADRRLEVAKEDLDTAKSNINEEHFRAANNRAYYSIYHSICAVFALDDVSYKRHKDTIANFNKEYIKNEIFPREIGKLIGKAEIVRHNSDYDDFYIVTKEESMKQVNTAEMLYDMVYEYINKKRN